VAPGIDAASLVHAKIIPFKIKAKIPSKAFEAENNDRFCEAFH
jgi:hypothetical protein